MTQGVVLPSGGFCEVETIRVIDMAAAFAEGNTGILSMAILAHRLATIDGEPITLGQVLHMSHADAAPIFHLLTKQMDAAFKTREGIA